MAKKKKKKLESGYYDANTSTLVTDANIVEDSKGWKIVKNDPAPIKTTVKKDNNNNQLAPIKTTTKAKNYLTTQDGYIDTGKKLGEYSKVDYENRKDWKVYSKDDKFYFYNERTKKYEQITNQTGNEMKSADSIKPKKKAENNKKQIAPMGNGTPFTTNEKNSNIANGKINSKSEGGNTPIIKKKDPRDQLNIENRLKLDTSNLEGTEYNRYAGQLMAEQDKQKKKYSKTGNNFIDSIKENVPATITTTSYLLNKGMTKGVESILDMGATAGAWVTDKTGNKKISKDLQNWVKEDRTSKIVDSLGTEMKLASAENSTVVKRNNIAGKVVEGIGEMAPTLFIGGVGNAAKAGSLLNKASKLATYGSTGLIAGGSGAEEALNANANIDDATKYAIFTGATAIATEWITGGIPGVKGTAGKGVDHLVSKALKGDGLNQASKSLSHALFKAGYRAVGEGTEEAIEEIINPFLKNISYSQGETIDWKAVGESAIVGAIVGGTLNMPSTVSDINNSISNKTQNIPINNVETNIINQQLKEYKTDKKDYLAEQTNSQKDIQQPQETISGSTLSNIVNNQNNSSQQELNVSELQNSMEQFIQQRNETKDIKERQLLNNQIEELQNKINLLSSKTNPTLKDKLVNKTKSILGNLNNSNQNINIKMSDAGVNEIQQKTRTNLKEDTDTKFVPIEEVLPLKASGGYRTTEQVIKLIDNIRANGITSPIELTKNPNGEIIINNGNHRLEIANQLGLKEVPIKFNGNIEDYGKLLYNKVSKEYVDYIGGEVDGNYRNSKKIQKGNNTSRIVEGSINDNNISFEDEGTTRSYDRVSAKVGGYNNGSSSNTTHRQDNKRTSISRTEELENNSFFDDRKIEKQNEKTIAPLKEEVKEMNKMIAPLKKEIKNLAQELETTNKQINKKLDKVEDKIDNQAVPVKNKISNTQNLEMVQDIGTSKMVNLPKPPKTPKDNGEIAQILDDMPEKEKKKNGIKETLTTKIVDKGYYIDKLARKFKNRELSSKYDYSLQSNGIANQVIGAGRYDLNTGEKIGKGLYEVFEPVENANLVKEFSDYLYHKHNIDRMSLDENYYEDNKPVFGSSVTAQESRQKVREYEIAYPEFLTWAQDVYDYNNANLDMMVEYGMLSQESKDYYNEKYPHYVPIVRDNSRVKVQYDILPGKNASINMPIKKAKGGNQNLLPLKDAMALRTMQTVNSALRNNFGRELYKTLYGDIEQINSENTLDENIIDGFDEDTNVITPSDKQKNATFTIYNSGEKTTMEISDEVYEALKPSEIKTVKALNKLNSFRRGVITEYNPTFMFTNPIKDIQDGFINSKHPTKFIRNLPRAVKEVVSKGEYSKRYIANGGSWETYFNYNQGTKLNNETKKEKLPIKAVKILPRGISRLNEIIEMTPRMSEFISSLEAGDSIETATYNAQEVTTNFKRGGDWTKTLDRNGVTFLNASMQGAAKQIRNIQDGNTIRTGVGLAVKFAVVGVSAQILNNMLWGDDDDDYNNLSDYVKNNYYILGKYGDGEFIRIPRGRVTSVIQKLFDDAGKLMKGKKIKPEEFFDLLSNQVIPTDPTESNLLSPIFNVIENKAWYGGDLVPTRLQKMPNAEQYDEKTDSISKWLGEKLGASPYKINYLLDQYSGVIGDLILPYLTQKAESDSDNAVGKLIAPMKNKFTTDSVIDTQLVSDIYDLSDELTKKKNSIKATDEDILKFKYINSTVLGMSDFYKEKREIESSNLKDSEKSRKVREKQKEINDYVKKALETYEDVKIDDDTAWVGKQEYYLNKNNEWTKRRSK